MHALPLGLQASVLLLLARMRAPGPAAAATAAAPAAKAAQPGVVRQASQLLAIQQLRLAAPVLLLSPLAASDGTWAAGRAGGARRQLPAQPCPQARRQRLSAPPALPLPAMPLQVPPPPGPDLQPAAARACQGSALHGGQSHALQPAPRVRLAPAALLLGAVGQAARHARPLLRPAAAATPAAAPG